MLRRCGFLAFHTLPSITLRTAMPESFKQSTSSLVAAPGLGITPVAVTENTTEPNAKRTKLSTFRIGTHNGTFHCDEALAVFLLRILPEYRNSDLTRTRDENELAKCDIVVDVGAKYDPSMLRFDHHQRGFEENFGHGFGTKLSSAGLIYKHYGREVIAEVLKIPVNSPSIDVLYLKMYKEFIEAIDGVDNGITQYPDVEPRYVSSTSLSSRVSYLNARWNESVDSASVDAKFLTASKLTGTEFLERLDYYAAAWLPARKLVESAYTSRKNVHASGRIILFDQFAPWKEHLFDIEKDLHATKEDMPYYVIYADETAGSWRVQAVPVSSNSFESRKALPEAWRGLRDDVLSKASGIPDGIFIHASGFIGGNKTKEGALAIATRSLEI